MAEEKKYLGQSGVAVIRDWANGKFVEQEEGKGLSKNDLTDALLEKINGVEAGAEVNVIEEVQVNGSALTVSEGKVNVVVPTKTSEITNDSGFITTADIPEGAAASTTVPLMDGEAAVGTEMAFARGDHRHPTDTSRAAAADLNAEITRAKAAEEANATAAANAQAAAEAASKLATDNNTAMGERVAAIEADYLKAADKTTLEGKIAEAQAAAEKVANDNNTAMDTRVKAIEADYLKAADIADMATDAEVEQAVGALKSEVEGKGYQNAEQVSAAVTAGTTDMATKTWVGEQSYETVANVESKIAAAISAVYKPQGSAAFASLPALSANIEGFVFNISDAFVTDANFVEGAGASYPAGTNVVCVEVDGGYKWDVLSGILDLTPYAKTADLAPYAKSEDIVEFSADEITAILNA